MQVADLFGRRQIRDGRRSFVVRHICECVVTYQDDRIPAERACVRIDVFRSDFLVRTSFRTVLCITSQLNAIKISEVQHEGTTVARSSNDDNLSARTIQETNRSSETNTRSVGFHCHCIHHRVRQKRRRRLLVALRSSNVDRGRPGVAGSRRALPSSRRSNILHGPIAIHE